ncbi:MAG: TatD family hydrolase [Succinivibrionaceae bacterium]
MNYDFIDTHCHLTHIPYDTARDVIVDAISKGVNSFWIPAVKINEVAEILSLKSKIINDISSSIDIKVGFGVHPQYSNFFSETIMNNLFEEYSNKIDFIGEIGIDKRFFQEIPLEIQENAFIKQCNLALENNLPLNIHCVGAHDILLKNIKLVLKSFSKQIINKRFLGIIHAYSGSIEQAYEYKKLNFKFGVGAKVLDKNSKKLRELIKAFDTSDIVYETDYPYTTSSNLKINERIIVTTSNIIDISREIKILKNLV